MTAIAATGGATHASGPGASASTNDSAEINQLKREVQQLRHAAGATPVGSSRGGATQFDQSQVPPPPQAHFDVASVYAANSPGYGGRRS